MEEMRNTPDQLLLQLDVPALQEIEAVHGPARALERAEQVVADIDLFIAQDLEPAAAASGLFADVRSDWILRLKQINDYIVELRTRVENPG